MVWCYFGFARTERPPFVPFLVYEFQVGFYPRRSEVWEWGFRNCIFDTCSFPCNRISMNFPYLCIYRSSEGASLMVWPKCWESNLRSGPTGTEWDTPPLSENKDSESGGGVCVPSWKKPMPSILLETQNKGHEHNHREGNNSKNVTNRLHIGDAPPPRGATKPPP